MANTLSFSVTSIAADRATGVLTDGTTYSDPLRAATGLFVKGQKINSENTVESTLTVTGNAGDPETDASFTFTIPKDGWFRFLIVSVPDYDAGTEYDLYDAVFVPATDKVYRSKQNSNTGQSVTDTAWFEEITDPATLASNEGEANESANIDSLVYEPGLFPNAQYGFGNVISEASEEYLSHLNVPDDDLANYTMLACILDGGVIKGERSEMIQAERIARRLESIIESFD